MDVCEKKRMDVEKAMKKAVKETQGTEQWGQAVERVFREIVKLYLCVGGAEDMGYVLAEALEAAMEEGDEE